MAFFLSLFGNKKKDIVPLLTYELWLEGIPSKMLQAQKVATVKGVNFNDAVRRYIEKQRHISSTLWFFDVKEQRWQWNGRRAYCEAYLARLLCG